VLLERPLTHQEMQEFCGLVFGIPWSVLPSATTEWNCFFKEVSARVAQEPRQWNPLTKKTEGWLNLKKLGDIYGGSDEKKRRHQLAKLKKKRVRGHRKQKRRATLRSIRSSIL